MNSKWGFDWSQESTKRNAVWLVAGILCIVFIIVDGKEDRVLIVLSSAATIASGLGVFRRD